MLNECSPIIFKNLFKYFILLIYSKVIKQIIIPINPSAL